MADERGIRLNLYLARCGLGSRRQADAWISAGRVQVDGLPVTAGQRVREGQTVLLDGEAVIPQDEPIIIALNKPPGITCTTDRRRTDNIIDFLGLDRRVFPIGRLDRDSGGLILLTNDGSIVNRLLRADYGHEKEYRVTINRPADTFFYERMRSGVPILDTVTLPCKVVPESPNVFRIVLTQGLNRQIRRMCEALGYEVVHLVRIRILHITLGTLPLGRWRQLTAKEEFILRKTLQGSVGASDR